MSANWAIEFQQVSKTFGRRRRRVEAVRELSLQIAPGQVYGFLGPNGAGKSTSIRMLMDLIRPTAGQVQLFDRPVQHEPAILANKVVALVEGAVFYNYLTGRRNLEILARTQGHFDAAEVQALLEQVGMADRADRKVAGYSTGMRQRLGIAAALLHAPDLVILDEPTNGLDPAGIQEIRTFIRDLVDKRGKTVFLSSHMLGEVEQVCDRVAIIDKGRLIREGQVSELLAEGSALRLEVSSAATAAALLTTYNPIVENETHLVVTAEREQTTAILGQLLAANIAIYQVTTARRRLEDVFLHAVKEENGA